MKVKELVEYLNTLDGEMEVVNPVYDYDMFDGYEEYDSYNCETTDVFMTDHDGAKDFYFSDGGLFISPGDWRKDVPSDAVKVKALII